MKQTPTSHPSSARHRRIGRKVLLADRLSHSLNASKHKKTKFALPFLPSLRPKTIALLCAAVIGVGALGFVGSQMYFAKVDAAQKTAATQKQRKQAAKSLAAEACRRKKAEQKADLIGKVTYDQLYDYGECDK